jgi:hypothetical protein
MTRRVLVLLFAGGAVACSSHAPATPPEDPPAVHPPERAPSDAASSPITQAAWAPDCRAFEIEDPPSDTPTPTADELDALLRRMWVPGHMHVGVHGAREIERAEWRERFRAVHRELSIHATGSRSGIERAFEANPGGGLFSMLPFLVLEDFPELLRDGDHLATPELTTHYRRVAALVYCRALTSDDPDVRITALRRSVWDMELELDPTEPLGLGPIVARLLEAPDRATRFAALGRLCGFDVPPSDARTVVALQALLREPEPIGFGEMRPDGCVTWLLRRMATDESVAALVENVFADPRGERDGACALAGIYEPRHAALVRDSYRRVGPGYSFVHVGPANYAAPLLSQFELLDVVRDDLRSDDGDLVDRGIRFAAHLRPADAIVLLREASRRTDFPDPPPGEHADWGNHEGLRNEARDALAHARRMSEVPTRDRCAGWPCGIPTYGRTDYPECQTMR